MIHDCGCPICKARGKEIDPLQEVIRGAKTGLPWRPMSEFTEEIKRSGEWVLLSRSDDGHDWSIDVPGSIPQADHHFSHFLHITPPKGEGKPIFFGEKTTPKDRKIS